VQLRVRAAGPDAFVDVEDNGRGIAPDDLERLGTSFFTTRPNGTGLGVVLAQGVIAQHGGKLTYTSTVGRGTIAKISLPTGADGTTRVTDPAPRAAMIEARLA
jgi:signal transduction histidine kinase